MKYILTLLITIYSIQGQNVIVNTTGRDNPLLGSQHIQNGRIKLTNLTRTDLSNNPLTIGTSPISYSLGGSITNHLLATSGTVDIPPGESRKAFIVLTNGVPITTIGTYTFNIQSSTVYIIGVDPELPPGIVEPVTNKTVSLQWEPNTEPDLAGYKLYYGTSTGVYTVTNDVGGVTSTSVAELTAGIEYFFALTAYNTTALESTFSNEVSDTK